MSEVDKIVFSVAPSLILINVVIGIYIYKAIKDPENYKIDEPLKQQIPIGLREQNMNKRWEEKQKNKNKLTSSKDKIKSEWNINKLTKNKSNS